MPLAAMPLTHINVRRPGSSTVDSVTLPCHIISVWWRWWWWCVTFFSSNAEQYSFYSIFQKQWKSTQNLTEQIFEKPFYLQFNWQKLRWTRIKKIYKFLLQTQRDENIEWLSNSIHETIRFAFCTLYSSTYCLWSESISAKWLFWAVAAATNEHKTNTEKNRKTQKKTKWKRSTYLIQSHMKTQIHRRSSARFSDTQIISIPITLNSIKR